MDPDLRKWVFSDAGMGTLETPWFAGPLSSSGSSAVVELSPNNFFFVLYQVFVILDDNKIPISKTRLADTGHWTEQSTSSSSPV
jgi:hypothetical protein